jgi:hypothetical protein
MDFELVLISVCIFNLSFKCKYKDGGSQLWAADSKMSGTGKS